ncbi:hypothetical protein BC834DRAFT_454036 [Gloeopeniophorella convolvens]|nr:hypothetical protein BC834DRAFT_454036 [Gloeopeniophorella convolvens]
MLQTYSHDSFRPGGPRDIDRRPCSRKECDTVFTRPVKFKVVDEAGRPPGDWELSDSWASQKANLIDMLSHVSGLPKCVGSESRP